MQEKKLNERLKPVPQDYDSVTFCTKLFPLLYEMLKLSHSILFTVLFVMSNIYYLGCDKKTEALFRLRGCVSDQRFCFFAHACCCLETSDCLLFLLGNEQPALMRT